MNLGVETRKITGTQLVHSGACDVYGFVVNSHTSGTAVFYDGTDATGKVILSTFTFPSGSGVYEFPAPVACQTGLYVELGGTAADITIFKQQK